MGHKNGFKFEHHISLSNMIYVINSNLCEIQLVLLHVLHQLLLHCFRESFIPNYGITYVYLIANFYDCLWWAPCSFLFDIVFAQTLLVLFILRLNVSNDFIYK